MTDTDSSAHLPPIEGPRFLSRRFASAKEILGEQRWNEVLTEFTSAMEDELDAFLALLMRFDRLHEAQAHIILGELIAHTFYEAE